MGFLRLMPLFRSLRVKILLWLFVPTAIILVAVAVENFYAYQEVTEDLVIDRDADLARLSAGQVATELQVFVDRLAELASTTSISQPDSLDEESALQGAGGDLVVFDAGAYLLDSSGIVIASQPHREGLNGSNWSQRSFVRQVRRFQQPHLTDVVPGPDGVGEAVAVAVPVTDEDGLFAGSLVGMFSLDATTSSAFFASIVRLRIKKDGNAFLVDSKGRVIYHSNSDFFGRDFGGGGVVTRVLSPNPPKDTDGRREDSGRGWVRELQGRWPGVLG